MADPTALADALDDLIPCECQREDTIAAITRRAEAAERACEDAKRREQEASAKMQAMAQSESNRALRREVERLRSELRLAHSDRDRAFAGREQMHKRAQEAERLVGLAMRVGQAECESMRARMQSAEAKSAAYRRELHRIACGEQVEGDGLCEYGIEAANLRTQLSATQDAAEDVGYEAFQCAEERDAARFLAAGWKRLAKHYQSCHIAGHACLRETHRKLGEARAELAALTGPGVAVNPDAYLRGLE